MEYVIVLGLVYFIPAFLAAFRGHHNSGAIGMLNIFLGWTIIGWIAALVWASTEPRHPPSSEPTKRCPQCAELVLAQARKCKHCGSEL